MTRIEKVAEMHGFTNASVILQICNAKCPANYGLHDECHDANGECSQLMSDQSCVYCWLKKCTEAEEKLEGEK